MEVGGEEEEGGGVREVVWGEEGWEGGGRKHSTQRRTE